MTDPRDDRHQLERDKGHVLEGICEWILRRTEFIQWDQEQSASRLLWIHGDAGMGKTMLSIYLTKLFERDRKHGDGSLVLYYFCDGREEKRKTAVSILRGLMWCLLLQRPKLLSYLQSEFDVQQQSLFAEGSFTALWRIFRNMISHANAGPVYCLIDALNECTESSRDIFCLELRHHFATAVNGTPNPILGRVKTTTFAASSPADFTKESILKMIVVSRTGPELDMPGVPCIQLGASHDIAQVKRLEPSQEHLRPLSQQADQSADSSDEDTCVEDTDYQAEDDGHPEALQAYKEAKIRDLSNERDYSTTLASELTNMMKEKGNGTFLWVDLAIAELNRTNSDEEVKAVLSALPDAFNPMYRRILVRIPHERRERAILLLNWVLCALRPLELSELQEALDLLQFSENEAVRQTVEDCSGLIAEREGLVKFAHHAARDFLISDELRNDPESSIRDFVIDEQKANGLVAQRCITYAETIIANGALKEMNPIFKALSSRNVVEKNMQKMGKGVESLENKMASLKPRKMFRLGRKKSSKEETDEAPTPAEPSTPDLEKTAAMLDEHQPLTKVIPKRALADYAIMNWFHHCRRTKASYLDLSSPMFGQSFEIRSDWLYLYWSDSFAKPKYLPWGLPPSGFTCLHMLSMLNLDEIAASMWEDNLHSQLNVEDSRRRMPLSYAAELGNTEIAELLLARGADLSCVKLTLLNLACINGHAVMAEKLLDASFRTSRRLTVEPDTNERMVHTLASRLADKTYRKFHGSDDVEGHHTLITNATRLFFLFTSIVGGDTTDLHCAVFFGHLDLAQMLLDRGYDINYTTTKGYTPLLVGAHRGRFEIVKMLLERRANVQAKTKDGWTVLHHAAFGGNKDVLELAHEAMLGTEAGSIDLISDAKHTPLHAAAMAARPSCVEFLLSCQCHVDAQCNNKYTSLHYAAEKNAHQSAEVVRLLVQASANLESMNSNGETPLHCTVRTVNFQVMTVLLWLGANGEAETSSGQKPLQLVVKRKDWYKDYHAMFSRNPITGVLGSAESVLADTLKNARDHNIGRHLAAHPTAIERARRMNFNYESYAFTELDPTQQKLWRDRYGIVNRLENTWKHISGVWAQAHGYIYDFEDLKVTVVDESGVLISSETRKLIATDRDVQEVLSQKQGVEVPVVAEEVVVPSLEAK